jgi:hypothetical protein
MTGRSEGKKSLERQCRRWDDHDKMDPKTGCDGMDCIEAIPVTGLGGL